MITQIYVTCKIGTTFEIVFLGAFQLTVLPILWQKGQDLLDVLL